MSAESLIAAKKELRKLQNTLGKEMSMGKYKDTEKIKGLKREIKEKKLNIGDITKQMISQLSAD